jgi:hypothetical protein
MRRVLLSVAAFMVAVLVVRVWAAPPVKSFQGYWMGIDPVDGGDQRRSFIRQEDGTFAMVGRDSFLRLCDSTDRGLISFSDGVITGRHSMASDNLKIACFNTQSTVILRARYELIEDNLMTEETTMQDGTRVQVLVLHRISPQ